MALMKRLHRFAELQPNQVALQFDTYSITYGELAQYIDDYCDRLSQIPKHQFVAVGFQQTMETMLYYLALQEKECIPCVFDHSWPSSQVNQLLQDDGIPFYIDGTHEIHSYTPTTSPLKLISQDLLHVGFTSGTTGFPKGYYRNEMAWIRSYEQNEQLFNQEITMIIAPGPLAHSLSLYACIYALYTGRTFLGQAHFEPQTLIHMMNEAKQSAALFAVPTMLHDCVHQCPQSTKYLKSILSSGDKLSEQLRRQLSEAFPAAQLIEFFGSSEASFISYNCDNEAPADSVGRCFPNVEVQLADKDDQGIGRLFVKSNMTFSGYIDEEKRTNDWIEIGDYASLDPEGYLYLHGRANDKMIIGGKNVYPVEIERVISQYPTIEEVLVISEAHPRFGEVAVALYTGKETVSYAEMRDYLAARLSRYQIPSKWKRVNQMRYTPSGKIARGQMKRAYEEGELIYE
ncbi:AMP-binding protein [Staphylococcus auricularis]|uniref:AMP-binding protein n=1 Tax=Staphylococcus auricularis TaxID=29379 RepID=UPI003EB9BEE6